MLSIPRFFTNLKNPVKMVELGWFVMLFFEIQEIQIEVSKQLKQPSDISDWDLQLHLSFFGNTFGWPWRMNRVGMCRDEESRDPLRSHPVHWMGKRLIKGSFEKTDQLTNVLSNFKETRQCHVLLRFQSLRSHITRRGACGQMLHKSILHPKWVVMAQAHTKQPISFGRNHLGPTYFVKTPPSTGHTCGLKCYEDPFLRLTQQIPHAWINMQQSSPHVRSINKITVNRSKCAFTSFMSFTASWLQCHCHSERSNKWSLQHGSKVLFNRVAFQMCSGFELQAILDHSNKAKQGWVVDFKQSNPCQSFTMNTQSHWCWHLRKFICGTSRKNETCHLVTQLLHGDFFRRHPCRSLNHIFRPQSSLKTDPFTIVKKKP